MNCSNSFVMSEQKHRCGFAAVVGRPNVGKSTLVNALLQQKVSIVTAKPQTTRHRILGISTAADSQVIFVDTPGIHRGGKRAMNRVMNRTARQSLADADVALFVIEALRWTNEDEDICGQIRESGCPAILVINKTDRVRDKEKILPFIEDVSQRYDFKEIVPISALKDCGQQALREMVTAHLPVTAPCYPADQISDRNEAFRAAEIVREKLTEILHQELPYGLAVEIERFEDSARGRAIGAVIWVEKPSQKAIVIGRDGQLLKRAGQAARLELKAALGRPVHLELWVKVKKNWSDSDRALRQLGYEMQ